MNKELKNSHLDKLFKEISLEVPSEKFAENLMKKIEKEAIKKKRKMRWLTIGQVAAGIIGILSVPGLTFYFCNLFIPESSLSFSNMYVYIDPKLILIGCSILFLLIMDTLIRKHMHHSNKKDN